MLTKHVIVPERRRAASEPEIAKRETPVRGEGVKWQAYKKAGDDGVSHRKEN